MVRAVPISGTTLLLGPLGATPVAVPPGGTGATAAIPFPLPSIAIGTHGIGRYDVSWHWQMQLTASGPWVTFDRSDHTVYVTIDLPGAPWGQAADAAHQFVWPWTEVLDWACDWAHGVRITSTAEVAAATAARRIEQGIFDLGTRASVPLNITGSRSTRPPTAASACSS